MSDEPNKRSWIRAFVLYPFLMGAAQIGSLLNHATAQEGR